MSNQTIRKIKYVHTEEAHNTRAASIIVPIVNELIFRALPPPPTTTTTTQYCRFRLRTGNLAQSIQRSRSKRNIGA
jgi:hypothetical protein